MKNRFLFKAFQIVHQHLDDESFRVSAFSDAMNLSRMQLHRRLKQSCHQSPGEFIRNIRLKKSQELLKESSLKVGDISFLSGFNSESYFIHFFKKQTGMTPGQFRKESLKITTV